VARRAGQWIRAAAPAATTVNQTAIPPLTYRPNRGAVLVRAIVAAIVPTMLACTRTSAGIEPAPYDASPAAIETAPFVATAIEAPAPEPPTRAPVPALPAGERVTLDELVAALESIAIATQDEPAVRADFDALREQYELPDDPALYRDYVRVKIVFESARDGGLWQLRWRITNREPRSDAIWSQWAAQRDWDGADTSVSATAECDELSALFAFLVRRLGVENVGLFWPTWNHTVAVWTVTNAVGEPVRIVVPTSQIFLGPDATLGTREFDPRKQKTIYEYRRRDAKPELALPAALARFFVERTWAAAHRPQLDLQRERNERSARLGGS